MAVIMTIMRFGFVFETFGAAFASLIQKEDHTGFVKNLVLVLSLCFGYPLSDLKI